LNPDKKSISVELQGGLGNQLFGWAAGFALSKKMNLDLTLNTSNLIARRYELDAFRLSEKVKLSNTKENRIRRINLADNSFEEKSFQYDKRFEYISKPKRLKGYFQSWKYFDDYKSEIQSLLYLKQESNELRLLSEMTSAYQVLGVHIRRGDYVGLENYHGLTSSRYFKNAVQMIQKLSGFEKIMVFSDDIAVAREVFPQGDYYISSQELDSSPETLILMSRCKSFIGSNSSFSWWAGYIGSRHSEFRIFPRPWFTNPSIDSRDLLPPNWITLGI
jgi:Glycosyl transferase family 11